MRNRAPELIFFSLFLFAVSLTPVAVLRAQAATDPENQASAIPDPPQSTEEILSMSSWVLDLEESGLPSLSSSSGQAVGRAEKRSQPESQKRSASLSSYLSLYGHEDFHPVYGDVLSTWSETTMQTRLSLPLRQGHTVSLGWFDGRISQENNLFNDTDFNLQRQGPFFDYDLALPPSLRLNLRVRDERFTDRDDSGFYRINDDTHLATGYLAINYLGKGFWAAANYTRERETDPEYDFANNRAALNIRAKELSGLASGFMLADNWEIGGSLYHEQYGTARPTQWNANVQLSHWPLFLQGLRISIGSGYYTEEEEKIYNLAIAHQWRPLPPMSVQIEYQMEYSENDDSLLNEGSLLCSWDMGDRFFFDVRTRYAHESGGDRDEEYFLQAALRIEFF
ncbi:MAG: hypothetical protein A2512_09730 [Deltaproteobacteria bacterium RIFOXYD12_FULL_56_24]|nr:MAG: hypothetical protein A2512_09730 [Deltaproteobacteria bacterium RIFOXYD12_FULL_56_24]